MSNTRIFWIIWCSMWALLWLLVGFFTFLLGWLLVPVSLLAILIPVGAAPTGRKYVTFQPPQPPWQPSGQPTAGPEWPAPHPTTPQPPWKPPTDLASYPPPAVAPLASQPAPPEAPAGWYPDPYGQPRMRWWDGQSWAP